MALIICPECGKTISDKAAACIGCGCPVSEMNMETVKPAGRAQRRRRYQPEGPETMTDTPAKPAFDQAAFDAALQECFTRDVPIRLQTQTPAGQENEAAKKAEAIQRLAQAAGAAAAKQAAVAAQTSAPVRQMPLGGAQVAPSSRNTAMVSLPAPRPTPAGTAPVNAAAPSASSADKPAAPAPAKQPAPRPTPAGTVPVNAAAPSASSADKPAAPAPARQPAPRPTPAGTVPVNAAAPSASSADKPAVPASAKQPAPRTAPEKTKKAKEKKTRAASESDAQPGFVPDNVVPSEMPEYGIFFGTIMTLLREGIGVLSYAAMAAVAAMVVDLLSSGSGGGYIDPEILLGLLGGYAIAVLVVNLDFLRARRFLRKGGYLDAIRNDGPGMTNCVNAYKLYPSRAMIWYIKRLNPAHGAKIAQWAKEAKQEKRKARLRYLLYALVLAVVFYFLPRYEMIYDLVPMLGYYIPLYLTPTQILLIEHLITLVVVILYTDKNGADLEKLNLEVLIVFAGVFALMLYVYDMGDLWYHIIINAVVVFAAFIIGGIWHVKKKADS